jgi:hypothetical protein
MPRLTLLRALKLLLILWLVLIFVWVFLPSPEVPPPLRDKYIQNTLISGKTITTVHDWDHPTGECAAYAIDWQLIPDTRHDSLTLHIGTSHINLTEPLVSHEDYPRFDIATRTTGVRSGDLNHMINMPWFDYADANLFHHQMHGFDSQLKIRLVATASGVVQVWMNNDRIPSNSDGWKQRGWHRGTNLLGAFSGIEVERNSRSSVAGIETSYFTGRLPSRTYYFRSNLLEFLAPTLIVALYLFETVIFQPGRIVLVCLIPIIVLYALIVLCCWLVSGRPPFRGWSSRFPLTRYVFRKQRQKELPKRIWGPTGPVMADDDDDNLSDEEQSRASSKGFSAMLLPRFRSPSTKESRRG